MEGNIVNYTWGDVGTPCIASEIFFRIGMDGQGGKGGVHEGIWNGCKSTNMTFRSSF